MSTYLDAVNQVLRREGILLGDDDAITSFSSTQHASAIEFAKLAITDEYIWLSDRLSIPYTKTTGTITLVSGTRLYEFPSDFEQFSHEHKLWKVNPTTSELESTFLAMDKEHRVRALDPQYETVTGNPNKFYFAEVSSSDLEQVGLYPTPEDANASEQYKFWYDKRRTLSVETDIVPLIGNEQFNAFCGAAGRRFKFMRLSPAERNALFPQDIERDSILEAKRATLLRTIGTKRGPYEYGRKYA